MTNPGNEISVHHETLAS